MVDYLFNSSGEWICFKVNKFIWDKNGKLIGWLPWGDNEVVSMKGDYLGTIVDRDRIYYFTNHPYRGNPGYPGYPGFAGYKPLPSGAKDIVIKK